MRKSESVLVFNNKERAMTKIKEELIRLNVQWVQSSLDLDRFARLHGMTTEDMDKILAMVQSWEESRDL
jgi:hypothetical protein